MLSYVASIRLIGESMLLPMSSMYVIKEASTVPFNLEALKKMTTHKLSYNENGTI